MNRMFFIQLFYGENYVECGDIAFSIFYDGISFGKYVDLNTDPAKEQRRLMMGLIFHPILSVDGNVVTVRCAEGDIKIRANIVRPYFTSHYCLQIGKLRIGEDTELEEVRP